jgi:hypothetical protein
MSSRKYFKYWPYFTGVRWKFCGKACGKTVDENVENPASTIDAILSDIPTFFTAKTLLLRWLKKD